MTAFTLYPGLSTAPSCVAAPFTAAPQPLTAAASLQFAFCYALSGAAGWSVVTSGVFTAAPFAFSSFNSNNQLLYYVGTGMTGTRTYLSSASATPQQSAITGLPGPGGDGQYDQKLYFNSSYLLDSGGWGYYVSPAAQVYGLTGSSSTVRLYNAGSNVSGPWLEAGLPQLQSTSLAQITASAFYLTPYSGQLYSSCSVSNATIVAAAAPSTAQLSFCYTSSSYANSPYGPWAIAVNGTLTVTAATSIPSSSLAPASAGGGRPAQTILSAVAQRYQLNANGALQTAQLVLCAAGVQGSDQLVYASAPYTDWNGFCLQVVSASDMPAGQSQWLLFPNGFPSQQIEIYYDLPSQNYPNIYHADAPFNPQLTISSSSQPLACSLPSTAPSTPPATSSYQFCYQAYATAQTAYGAWAVSIGGVMSTLSQPGLTASSALGLTASSYGQYVLSLSGTRLQQVGGNASSSDPIVGLSWINPGGLDGNDGNPDPYLLPSAPHLSGSCLGASSPAACFGGLVLYAASPFVFPNGVETIDSSYALVNAIYLRSVNGSVYEASGPTPSFSQLAVAAGTSAPACPLITAAASASSLDASPLFSTSAVQSSAAFNLSFGYYISSLGFSASGVPLSYNGYWTVQVTGILTVQPLAAPVYSGAANSSSYPAAYTVLAATGQRLYTDATGSSTVSQITGVAPSMLSYTAGSSQSLALGNDNVLYVTSTAASSLGYGSWQVDAQGLAFTIAPAAAAAFGCQGAPGFPSTARFNSFTYLSISSSSAAAGLQETGWGPITIDTSISAPASFKAELGASQQAYTTSLGVQLFSSSNPLPASLTAASTAYSTVGLCYIVYPHETQQNGQWSIATAAVLYVSPQLLTLPFQFTNGSGSVTRSAQLIYAVRQLSRVYTDQYGVSHTSVGAVLQGPGGDGGSDNLLYTSVVAGDSEGLLVDGDGFTYTLTGGGATTPGDPTLAFAINFYSETNYREAAEPWSDAGSSRQQAGCVQPLCSPLTARARSPLLQAPRR